MPNTREFMTGWFSHDAHSGSEIELGHMRTWSQREKAGLMGGAKGPRYVPKFRPFDLLTKPNQAVIFLGNEDQRVGVDSVVGCQKHFTRNIDFDLVMFQFAGETTVETEYGIYDMKPGDLIRIPEGIAHRSTGTADSLRMFVHLREPVIRMFEESQAVSHHEYKVIRHGGPNWTASAADMVKPKGRVVERMVTWRDRTADDNTVIERDYDFLVGASSMKRDVKESGVRRLRAFDFFTEITGQRGPGPKLLETPNFLIEVYNTTGEQFAFHRALRSEEFGLQFRGLSTNMSEFEASLPIGPGDLNVIPLGIAHSVLCQEDFLRTVWYSKIPWDVVTDVTKHAYESTWEIKTTTIKKAAWQQASAAE
jgi:quercetin dioxygenase-like cupin family protein